MGIWIRSQDGITLAECNRITIDGRSTVVNKVSEQQEFDCDRLGEYSSREEAIAAIDEISEYLHREAKVYIWQMPQRGFLKEKAQA